MLRGFDEVAGDGALEWRACFVRLFCCLSCVRPAVHRKKVVNGLGFL